jgi:V/A-type H+/Na+-transporting ATPase subunit I
VSCVAMRRLQIVALKGDMDRLLSRLGEAGCFQIARPGSARSGSAGSGSAQDAAWSAAFREAQATVEDIRRELDLEYPEAVPRGTRLPKAHDAELLASMHRMTAAVNEEEHRNLERSGKASDALEEARTFAGLAIPFKDLERLSFLAVRIGRIDPDELDSLSEALGDRAIAAAIGRRGDIVAVSTKKGRFALDTELARAGFEPRKFSPDFAGVPPELPAALERKVRQLESERADIWMRKAELRSRLAETWGRIAASYAVASCIEEAKGGLDSSSQAYRLEGWVPRDRLKGLAAELSSGFPGRIAIRALDPGEVEAVSSGEEDVPVLLKKRRFVSSFERMVLSFGVPVYGSVDPTPFVCCFFTLLFSIMFGDVGQGFLILAGAFAIRRGLIPSLSKWKPFAPIGIAAGIGSMIMGFLTGSVFTFEELLVPITRVLSGTLLGTPVDRFLTLLPEGGSARTVAFFGFTVALGVVVNSTGLAINIVNKLRRGELSEAIFSKTGAAGALLFWWAVGIGVRTILGSRLAWYDAIGLGLPLLALMLEEPLGRAVSRRGGRERLEAGGDGAFAEIVKGFVALLESVSYFLSGTLSFLRVGAFALAHVVLSFIVFTMGDMMRSSSPAGFIGQILVVLVGNSIIILLEGLVVAIQVVRLQYYEFLSKCLTENGRPFVPFEFHFRKEYT